MCRYKVYLLLFVAIFFQYFTTLSQITKTVIINGVSVDILTPTDSIKGNILVLPGWNYPRNDWCKKSSLCKEALARGYRLIMPEMGKSIYVSQFYPQTRTDWQKFPTRTWLSDTMISFLQQNEKILLSNQKNYAIGLSTGARGVSLILLNHPQLFNAAVLLSGDYEPTQLPQDNLFKGYYGEYQRFPQRWSGVDNPAKQASKYLTPMYLGHGKLDNMVPVAQTELFYDSLRVKNTNLVVIKYIATNHKHDYNYWDSEVKPALDFFQKY